MSAFISYSEYKTTFTFLQPGNVIAIQGKFYMVIQTRVNRKAVSVTGAQTKYALALDNSATSGTASTFLESMTGNLNKNRIIHIQYVSVTVADTPEFFWGTQPLQSKDVDDVTSIYLANLNSPLIVNRWSYDTSMRLYVTQGSVSQVYLFEIAEYEIVAYAGTPPRPYWQIMANGAAILVQTDEQAAAITATQLSGTSKPKL
jgi:hypothetical protein